jgi:hypothetical protein
MVGRLWPPAKQWSLRAEERRGFQDVRTIDRPQLEEHTDGVHRPNRVFTVLLSWLAALDDFRNWLIREAA